VTGSLGRMSAPQSGVRLSWRRTLYCSRRQFRVLATLVRRYALTTPRLRPARLAGLLDLPRKCGGVSRHAQQGAVCGGGQLRRRTLACCRFYGRRYTPPQDARPRIDVKSQYLERVRFVMRVIISTAQFPGWWCQNRETRSCLKPCTHLKCAHDTERILQVPVSSYPRGPSLATASVHGSSRLPCER